MGNNFDEYRKQIETELAELRASVAELESGRRKHFERLGNGPYRDITGELIAERKRAAASYEALLALMGRP